MTPQRLDVGCPNLAEGLTADWIVGFIDGEGCFHVGINKHDELRFKYQVLPELTVVQHERDINLLYKLKTVMQCGVVRRNHGDRYCWRVRSLKNLIEKIVPFFERNTLKSKKAVDFQKFAKVVRMMQEGKHLEEDGFNEILKIASTMNRGSERELGQRYSPHQDENSG